MKILNQIKHFFPSLEIIFDTFQRILSYIDILDQLKNIKK